MAKAFIGLFGLVLFLFCLNIGNVLQNGEKQAIAKDGTKKAFAEIGEDSPPFCTWNVSLPERIMAENKSQAILIQTTNPAKKKCESTLSLRAPGFDLSPPKDEQTISLPPKGKGSVSWIITPHRTGTFDLAVSDIVNTKILGVTVTNVFGLSAIQAKFFSIFGTIFGPMLTVPWWWDRFRRKPKQDPATNASGV